MEYTTDLWETLCAAKVDYAHSRVILVMARSRRDCATDANRRALYAAAACMARIGAHAAFAEVRAATAACIAACDEVEAEGVG